MRQRGVTTSKPSIGPYVFENFGSPTNMGGADGGMDPAAQPHGIGHEKRFCSSRSASIWVRSDPMAPSGTFKSLLRKPFFTQRFTPAGR